MWMPAHPVRVWRAFHFSDLGTIEFLWVLLRQQIICMVAAMAFLDQLDLVSLLRNDRVACSPRTTIHGRQAAKTRGLARRHSRLLHVASLRCSKLLASTRPLTTMLVHMARLATDRKLVPSHRHHLWQVLLPQCVRRGQLALRRLDPLRLESPLTATTTGST